MDGKVILLPMTVVLVSITATCLADELCTPSDCYGLNYTSIATYYNGIFLSKATIRDRDRKWREDKMKICQETRKSYSQANPFLTRNSAECRPNDLDNCCPTQLAHACESSLTNIHGESKTLLHMDFLDPPVYQWYPHATCGQSGSCGGKCRIEKITVFLLVYNLGGAWPFTFDSFEVDGYCSCKSS